MEQLYTEDQKAWIAALKESQTKLRISLNASIRQLHEYISLPENNVFATLDDASIHYEDAFRHEAAECCEGSGNVGPDEITQEFFVNGVRYKAINTFEYDRYDKQYYYIDQSRFKIIEVATGSVVVEY